MLKIISSGVLIVGLLASASTSALAQNTQAAIERVNEAYNVDYLEAAKTIRLEHNFKIEYDGHDYGPEFNQFSHQRQFQTLDLQNERGSSEYVTHIGNSNYHGRSIFKDGKSIFIDYAQGLYQDNGETDFISEYGRLIRASDVLLAIWLSRSEDTARYNREENWLGLPHDVLEIDFPSSPPLQIFVRRKDGAITKMEREVSEELTVYYTYDRHKKQDGSLIAQEYSFYQGGNRGQFSYNRNIAVNDRKDRKAFGFETGIVEEPERVDQSEMSVSRIGINADPERLLTHHVGLGETYTTFMRTGDFLTAFGAKAGFTERLKAYREDTGIMLPLRYAIVPDFHDEETAGATEAVAAGATLLTTSEGALALTDIVGEDAKIEVIQSEKTLSGLRVIPISTDHARSVLFGYFEPQKAALQSSHYASPYADAGFYAKYSAVTLYESLPEDLKNTPLILLTTESKKPENWEDFVSAVKNHDATPCHRNREICK